MTAPDTRQSIEWPNRESLLDKLAIAENELARIRNLPVPPDLDPAIAPLYLGDRADAIYVLESEITRIQTELADFRSDQGDSTA